MTSAKINIQQKEEKNLCKLNLHSPYTNRIRTNI